MGNETSKINETVNQIYQTDLINVLKQWSNKNTFNVVFDSDMDGDGSDNLLHNIVINRCNLYFITFDTNDNVFGGYISAKINKSHFWISDRNAFVFSLIQNGKVKNTKYSVKLFKSGYAFQLHDNERYGYLYTFGWDIRENKIGDRKSWCNCTWYNYKKEQKPLIDNTPPLTEFQAERIIIIQMD